jgi:hypothetical protein
MAGMKRDCICTVHPPAAYKQIMAPVGSLGLTSLKVSTRALAADDDTYANLESQLSAITPAAGCARRSNHPTPGRRRIQRTVHRFQDEASLVSQANKLLERVKHLQHGD